jgi:drug/metabolite transporter (DMT)-like permease
VNDQKVPVLLNLLAAFLGAFGQYYYKKGGQILATGGKFLNLPTVIGILLFCGVMGLFVVGYKLGGKISVVYPFYATTFIWGALMGVVFEKEEFHLTSFAGLLLVVAGVSLMAWSLGRS